MSEIRIAQTLNQKEGKMADLKGSKTEKNLLEAFAGESQARNKYTYFASAAKKEGYEQIAAIFQETADNEKEHAKLHFKLLSGIGDTIANLKAAAAGEGEEWTCMYPRMAAEAREEGFLEIAALFDGVGAIEKEHQERYLALLKEVENGTVFKKGEKVVWKCRNCGHIHEGAEATELCPVCKHPKAYFELLAQNY
jgi:rubrerythrin